MTDYTTPPTSSHDHKPTYLRWYNSIDGGKVACMTGEYEDIPYGGTSGKEFTARGLLLHPQFGMYQWGFACSRTSRVIFADIDHPENWKQGKVYVELGELAGVATSVRQDGKRAHIGIIVPEDLVHLWPVKGPAVWGDVISNGLCYHEGIHKSGLRYIGTGNPWVMADKALMKALTEDRIFPQGSAGSGTSNGTVAGEWWTEGYFYEDGTKWSRGVADTMSMVADYLDDDEITGRMTEILERSENYFGDGSEIEGWITSARKKLNIASGDEQPPDPFDELFNSGEKGTAVDGSGAKRAAAYAADPDLSSYGELF